MRALHKPVKIRPNLASFEEHVKNGAHQKIASDKIIEYYI